ncbi:MAG: MnhB domain-containing protein [Candidatus Cloacimonetes bacterium]|nr:MnhB domain-containing protein [Candidatus Cloacimonadota bacterium]
MGNNHVWQFSRVGGINRVNLTSGEDLLHLDSLDQKLWTALSCPVNGLEIDSQTLNLIDTDNDGKIRVPEILAAVKWLLPLINNADDLISRKKSMPLSAIKQSTPEGKTLFEAAKQILINLGKPDAAELSIADVSDSIAIFANTKFNGDGVITDISTDDEKLKGLVGKIITAVGSVQDRNGKAGISEAELNNYIALCTTYSAWLDKAETDKETILPFGDKTEDAFNLFSALKSKINDYFLRCRLAEFDPQSAVILNTLTEEFTSISKQDVSTRLETIAEFPLAKIEANKPLSFISPINPAWAGKLGKLQTLMEEISAKPVESITEDEWKSLTDKFAAYNAWKAEFSSAGVLGGIEEVREFLASDEKERLLSLIQLDKAEETKANSVFTVEKLVRFYCHIYTLLNNFVTFTDFYSPDKNAIFQAGTLYFDQRSCELCIKVSDMGKQAKMAASSGICLVYFDCVSKVKNEKMTIVAAFTDGDVDALELGRNAIFYDNKGLDWDATVVKIVDNPISIRQAFWSPYRKLGKLISKQMEKMASAQEAKVDSASAAGVAAGKPAPFDIAKFAGIFAAIGLAVGAIGTALASLIGGFLALVWWKIPLVLIGIMLLISLPSMFMAWMKLRKRNLAPILDANGWAINAKATINIPFGTSLTHLAKLPKNSKLNLHDPFKKKRNPISVIIMILLLIAVALALLWRLDVISRLGLM